MNRRRCGGQIAILFLVIAAVCVILALFLINLGQVGVNKTATAAAADSAVLSVASTLGTVSRQMALSLGGGKKYLDKKCKTDLLSIFLFAVLILVIIIIIVIVILSCIYAACSGIALLNMIEVIGAIGTSGGGGLVMGTLVLAAVGNAISLGMKEGIIEPRIARQFNRQYAKFANGKDPIREMALLGAFLRVVDDPVAEHDASDIDEDGDTTEEVSRFSGWYDARLKKLITQSVSQKATAQGEMAQLRAELSALVPELKALRTALKDQIIPIFAWIEAQGPSYDLSFWKPGDQYSSPLEPREDDPPCDEDDPGPCGPPLTALEDEVDWLLVQTEEFIAFAEGLLAMPDDVLLVASFQVEDFFKDYWFGEFKKWDGMMKDWSTELSRMKSRLPWPPTFTIGGTSPLCTAANCTPIWPPLPATLICTDPGTGAPVTGCVITASNPPVPPPAALLSFFQSLSQHPIDWIIQQLTNARNALKAFNPRFAKFTPQPVSTDTPIYSWKDNRGWHHVQVDIANFEIPRMKTKAGLFRSCVFVKYKSQQVTVKVTRYDQDNTVVGGAYTLRYRTNAAIRNFDDEGNDAEHENDATIRGKFLPRGITSEATAAHGWKPNTVGIVDSK